MEYTATYTPDPSILAWPTIGRWRLVCVVAAKDAGLWICHWERVG